MSLAPLQFKHFPDIFLKSFMFCFLSFLSPILLNLDTQDPTVSGSSCFLATQFDADFTGLASFWSSPPSWGELFYQPYEYLQHASPSASRAPCPLTLIAGYSKGPSVAAPDQQGDELNGICNGRFSTMYPLATSGLIPSSASRLRIVVLSYGRAGRCYRTSFWFCFLKLHIDYSHNISILLVRIGQNDL